MMGLTEPAIDLIASASRGIDPLSKEGELALLLVQLHRSLNRLVDSDALTRQQWLCSHNNALNGIPITLMESPEGLAAVLSYLDGMKHAV